MWCFCWRYGVKEGIIYVQPLVLPNIMNCSGQVVILKSDTPTQVRFLYLSLLVKLTRLLSQKCWRPSLLTANPVFSVHQQPDDYRVDLKWYAMRYFSEWYAYKTHRLWIGTPLPLQHFCSHAWAQNKRFQLKIGPVHPFLDLSFTSLPFFRLWLTLYILPNVCRSIWSFMNYC